LDDQLRNRGQQQVSDSQPLQERYGGVDGHHLRLTVGTWCGDRLDASFCLMTVVNTIIILNVDVCYRKSTIRLRGRKDETTMINDCVVGL